jgi:xanthine dehydrogenase YagR molybdenum-binding subunit
MQDGAVLIGMGMATSTYPTHRMPASAAVRLFADGSALVRAGTQDLGTGTYTTMAQVAGDILGLPVQRVRVELGDSRLPPAPISGGSMTSASVLPAVHAAALHARASMLALVATHPNPGWNGTKAEGLWLENGIVHGPAGQLSVTELLTAASIRWVDGSSDAMPSADSDHYAHHAFGAQFAEVRIDRDVGTLKVSRWVGAFDCGKLINPKTARSQLFGGIIFGIGMALMEETVIDAVSGRIVNSNIAEYLMPVNADIPDIQTIVVNDSDMITTGLGIKGIGELPTVGAAAAIANAVFHATGVRIRDLPIRLEMLLS